MSCTLRRQILSLPDGRRLAYRVVGWLDSNAPVVFLFHGMFANNYVFVMRPSPSYTVVLVDRPGYGRSSRPHKDTRWSYQHFAADVASLANHLCVPAFCVVGHSSGGPNALACAAHLPNRVEACAVLAGDPEYAHANLPDSVRDPLTHCLSFHSRLFLCLRGFHTDLHVERSAYDFDVADIRCPCSFFVGSRDCTTMRLGAEFMSSRVSNSTCTVLDGVGHITIIATPLLHRCISKLAEAADNNRRANASMHGGLKMLLSSGEDKPAVGCDTFSTDVGHPEALSFDTATASGLTSTCASLNATPRDTPCASYSVNRTFDEFNPAQFYRTPFDEFDAQAWRGNCLHNYRWAKCLRALRIKDCLFGQNSAGT